MGTSLKAQGLFNDEDSFASKGFILLSEEWKPNIPL